MNISLLRFAIKDRNYTETKFAKAIGMDPSTLSRKLNNGGGGFTLDEIHLMIKLLHLKEDDFAAIFYPQKK